MSQERELRVAVIEDDHRYRASVEELVGHTPGFRLIGGYASPLGALAVAAQPDNDAPPWDLVVMDLEMPHMSGIEATRQFKTRWPDLKVMVLTVFEDPSAILEAISAGADGYLLKKSRARELVEGLRSLADGGTPLTAGVARKVLDLVRTLNPGRAAAEPAIAPTRFDLTDREQQVLRALVDGFSYKQVAEALGISLGTVRSHIASIYRKLQVHNVAEAVSRAVRQRLV